MIMVILSRNTKQHLKLNSRKTLMLSWKMALLIKKMSFCIDNQLGSKYIYGKFYQNELVLAKSIYSKISMLVQLFNWIYLLPKAISTTFCQCLAKQQQQQQQQLRNCSSFQAYSFTNSLFVYLLTAHEGTLPNQKLYPKRRFDMWY